MFNMMKQKDPESLAIKLAHHLGPSQNIYTREQCAELLTKLIKDDDNLWHNLSASTQSTIKLIILDRIMQEESRFIISELVKMVNSLIPDNAWPELLPCMYQCITTNSSSIMLDLKRSVFLIFEKLADEIGETTFPCVKDLRSLFLTTLNDDTLEIKTRILAIRATITFIQRASSSNEKERFQDLLPGIMRTLTDALSSSREDAARHVLVFLNELARNEPRFLRRQLVVVVGSILDVAEDEKLQDETRALTVEFLITLVEAREKTPGMMKRLPLFISRCFAMLLKLLLDIEDDPAWHSGKIGDDAGTTFIFHVGRDGLRRFSLALGKSIAHTAKEQLCDYMASREWEKCHAALFALALIAKGCSKVMIKNWEQLMAMVLSCFQHPHPRVRWTACLATNELVNNFSPHFQEQYHNQLFPALAKATDDFQNPRVQAFAAEGLWICVQSKPETLIPHLDGIVKKLLVLIQNGKQIVLQKALNALSYIARFVKEPLSTYYDTVMPHLKAVLRSAELKSNLFLCARAMECISHVGFAGGKEKFREDAEQVMRVLISLQGQLQAKEDGPPSKYFLMACSRICQCLGQDFLPYMSAVMPFSIQCAQLEPGMTRFVESDKVKACLMLYNFANTLKEDFYPWIPQVVSVFIPLLKYDTQNQDRKYAVKAMPMLLHTAKVAVERGIAQGGPESYFTKLSDNIILSLLKALLEEPMTNICAFMLDKLNDCLEICGPLLSEGHVRGIVNEIKHVITESSSRKQEFTERAKTEDFDAEEAELMREEIEQEEVVFENVGRMLRTLIKTFKADFLPFLDELASYLLPMCAKEKTTNERYTSICIFVVLVGQCPEAALKYYEVCLPLILDASSDEDPDIRMNALYGLQLWAKYDYSSFKPFVGEVLSRINVVIMHFKALEPGNVKAYDYAVSLLGKICQHNGESIDSTKVIPAWLNCLPIKADLYEAKGVHEQLCSMIERSYREFLGLNYQYLPKVVSVFAEVLCAVEELATKETAERMINLLRYFQQTLPPATWASAWSLLLPQQEMELESVLSPEEDVSL